MRRPGAGFPRARAPEDPVPGTGDHRRGPADTASQAARAVSGWLARTALHARCGVQGGKRGCVVIGLVTVAALVLFAGWFIGAFALAPVHCSSPVCARWTRQLRLSVISSFAGLGRLVLAAMHVRPQVALPLGAGLLVLTALAGLTNPGMFVVTAVDFLLVVGVAVWFAVGWLD